MGQVLSAVLLRGPSQWLSNIPHALRDRVSSCKGRLNRCHNTILFYRMPYGHSALRWTGVPTSHIEGPVLSAAEAIIATAVRLAWLSLEAGR